MTSAHTGIASASTLLLIGALVLGGCVDDGSPADGITCAAYCAKSLDTCAGANVLSEVERVSDEVAILNKGTLLQKGSVDDFISIKEQFQIKVENGMAQLPQICQALQIPVTHMNDFYTVAVKEMGQLNELIDRLRQQKVLIQAIIPRKITLEDFFIEVIRENKGGEE